MEIKAPDFLLCENPIKDGSSEGLRTFIYVPSKMSLIEIFSLDFTRPIFNEGIFSKEYTYTNTDNIVEKYILAFVQNNCTITESDELAVLNQAWYFYEYYLQWEDGNIDEIDRATDN